jgi:hypothetical protein
MTTYPTPSQEHIDRVLAVIEATEGPDETGSYPCSNELLVEKTDLSGPEVAAVIGWLWRRGEIEGALTIGGGVKHHLLGIRRVLPGRARTWGADGYYQEQPG